MKILVVCQHYKPEPFRISDICEELVKRGHEVAVVTGVPNYPMGEFFEGYDNKRRKEELIDGVHVYRSFTLPRKQDNLNRLLNYFSFPMSSVSNVYLNRYKAQDGSDFDVVLVNQLSPVMMAWAGIAYAQKKKIPVLLYCYDLWPESLLVGGIKRQSMIFKTFHSISRKVYQASSKILVTSRHFSSYLQREFDIPNQKIDYLPQYAEDFFQPSEGIEDKEGIDLTFAGNIGSAQDLKTVVTAAAILEKTEDKKPVRFHLVGDGKELNSLRQQVAELGLSNFFFYGRRPLEDMPEFYQKADAMLVTLQADSAVSLTLPGKVQTYMAAGKPIIGAINGDTQEIVEEADCGMIGPASDVEALVDNIHRFSLLSSKQRKHLGQNARRYYEKNFSKDRIVDQLEQHLREVKGETSQTVLRKIG